MIFWRTFYFLSNSAFVHVKNIIDYESNRKKYAATGRKGARFARAVVEIEEYIQDTKVSYLTLKDIIEFHIHA